MKLKIIIGLYAGILLLSGCASNTSVVAGQSAAVNAESATKGINNEEPNVNDAHLDDTIYIGEYLDSDVNEPNLEIARGDDNKYIVQIGIYRLTSLSDGIGELTADGMNLLRPMLQGIQSGASLQQTARQQPSLYRFHLGLSAKRFCFPVHKII